MFSIHLPCKVLRALLETEGEARGFQHFLHVYIVPYLTFLNHSHYLHLSAGSKFKENQYWKSWYPDKLLGGGGGGGGVTPH